MPLSKAPSFLVAALAAALAATGCAYNATGVPPRPTLIFEYSIEGNQLYKGDNLAYYLVLNARPDPNAAPDGNPEEAPLVNGAAPLTYPYPDPRSYLPFVRDDETALLDREPISVPPTFWTDFFALFEDAGQYVMWQGRKNPDGTINERYRQLQQGREWGITDNKTVQITLPLDQLDTGITPFNAEALPVQIPANLAVATRNLDNPRPRPQGGPPRGVIDRWGQVQNFFFPIQTRSINQNLYDTISGVSFPENLPAGVSPESVNFQVITYRVVREE